MRLARSTILAPVPGRDDVLMVQPLSGQVALLEATKAEALRALERGGRLPADLPGATLRDARGRLRRRVRGARGREVGRRDGPGLPTGAGAVRARRSLLRPRAVAGLAAHGERFLAAEGPA
jgi:hypothetical protein